MNKKALHFNDADTSSKILASSDPEHAKSLGRNLTTLTLHHGGKSAVAS